MPGSVTIEAEAPVSSNAVSRRESSVIGRISACVIGVSAGTAA